MSDTLKYVKKNLHRLNCKVYSVNSGYNNSVELIVYKNKRILKLSYFGEHKQELLKFAPNKKLKIWFLVDSKIWNDKWFTNATLYFFEDPEALPFVYNNNLLFDNRGDEAKN